MAEKIMTNDVPTIIMSYQVSVRSGLWGFFSLDVSVGLVDCIDVANFRRILALQSTPGNAFIYLRFQATGKGDERRGSSSATKTTKTYACDNKCCGGLQNALKS